MALQFTSLGFFRLVLAVLLVFSPARSSPGPTHAAAGPARDRLLAVSRQGVSECVSESVSEGVIVSVSERECECLVW